MSLAPEHQWLLSPEADPYLVQTTRDLRANTNILKIVQRLRKTLTPNISAVVLELAQLRLRAGVKFTQADRMFLTTKGYEQASSERIAKYKSSLLPAGSRVLDLCSGIGGDLTGFCLRHHATAVDLDPLLCQYALRNASLTAAQTPQVICDNVLQQNWAGYDLLHIDPDRRHQQRTTDPRFIRPTLKQILEKATEGPLAIKLAPATRLPPELKPLFHREWIGEGRECKQQVVWARFAPRTTGRKSATLVRDDGHVISLQQSKARSSSIPPHCGSASDLGPIIYEPHAVVLGARLVDSLAADNQLKRIAPGIAYLTGEQVRGSPLLAGFRVITVKAAEVRQVNATLKGLDAGTMEWKKRGVDQSLYESLRKIRTKGKRPLTALVMPLANQMVCVICERLGVSD